MGNYLTASNERLLWKLLLVCNCSLKVNVQVKTITQSLACTFVFCFVIEYMITGLNIWTVIRQFEKKKQWKTLVLPYTFVPGFFLFSDYIVCQCISIGHCCHSSESTKQKNAIESPTTRPERYQVSPDNSDDFNTIFSAIFWISFMPIYWFSDFLTNWLNRDYHKILCYNGYE